MVDLIFHTAFVGDLLLTIPFLKQLRKAEPKRHLILAARPQLGYFFKHHKLVDEVLEIDKKSNDSIEKFQSFIAEKEFDTVYCPHQSFRSAWILRKIKAKKKLAYKQFWNGPFFDVRVERPMQWPEALRMLALLETEDANVHYDLEQYRDEKSFFDNGIRTEVKFWPNPIPEKYNMKLEARPDDVANIKKTLNVSEPYIVIAPSSQWVTKKWTPEGFADVILASGKKGIHTYLVGSQSEHADCENVIEALKKLPNGEPIAEDSVVNVAGQTNLTELHALMSDAKAVVANDSGAMHMACAAGVPVVSIFGPTTLDLGYRPWSNTASVAQVNVECRPCGKHGHKTCPLGTHECMKMVKSESVTELIKDYL